MIWVPSKRNRNGEEDNGNDSWDVFVFYCREEEDLKRGWDRIRVEREKEERDQVTHIKKRKIVLVALSKIWYRKYSFSIS